ncbi:MAG: TonB-dependent receptor [uncultured Aureispira sp.]|uniref:TonB-dependent receptor n=1 Tax=uncultured Aureispira sp. TaxID=1331704 RepID=A0A6S6TPI1_9BACT|nr:MAG: TonB-dependent receptor [uncultured Aureispira sp.]
MKLGIILTLFLFMNTLCAQKDKEAVALQTVRGAVVDQVTGKGLPNILVELLNYTPRIATISGEDGSFQLENVPIGYQRIRANGLNYYDIVYTELVIAGKQSVIQLKMEEEVDIEVATIQSNRGSRIRNAKMMTIDEMNVVSARPFNIEETNRFITGFGGLGKAVTNYPGLLNADDQQTYIVSRGYSPNGVQWMVEGVPIDNPNHFAAMGNTGAAFPILNNNLLASSDFVNGAFSARYGNVYAGMFDVNMRKGNNERHEFSAQINLFGAEFVAEGPFKKKGASYTLAVRGSIFGLLDQIGLSIGTSATPSYNDVNFKIDIPTKKAGHFSFFGIGGISNLDVTLDSSAADVFADENYTLNTYLGLVGFTHLKRFDNDFSLKTTLSYLIEDYDLKTDTVLLGQRVREFSVRNFRQRAGLSSILSKKFNSQFVLRGGVSGYLHFIDVKGEWNRRNELYSQAKEIQVLANAFVEARYKFSSTFSFVLGVQGMYWSLNKNSWSVEPRVALDWRIGKRHRLSLGYGWSSKIESFAIAFLVEKQNDGSYNNSNRQLGLNRSHQVVLSYDASLTRVLGIKANAYAAYSTNLGVDRFSSSFSLANHGAYDEYVSYVNLVSEGLGFNYGVEVSIEKFFSEGFYGLLSSAYQRSFYQGSDKVWRNSAFDAQHVTSLVMGKEFKIGKKKQNVIYGDFRFNMHGGLPYTPIDLDASILAGKEVLQVDKPYSERFDLYKVIDVRVGARFNHPRKRISHHFYVVLQNVADFENAYVFKYDAANEKIVTAQQFPFLPNLVYQLFF